MGSIPPALHDTRRGVAVRTRLAAHLFLAALALGVLPSLGCAHEGFGGATEGGAAGSVVRVTSLADAGPGSLRAALSGGSRTVAFDVAGTIDLATDITISGANVTVDGFTAPPPGITLRRAGLIIRGPARDVIVRGLRIRDAWRDGIWVTDAAHDVVIDHVSIHGSGDGNIDITREGTRDVTVSWSILAEPAGEEKNMLIAFRATRITLHHNVFVASSQRNPQVTFDDSASRTQDTRTTLDMRNNLVWNWHGGYGTRIRYGAAANVVDNYYAAVGSDAPDALIVCRGATSDSKCYDDVTNIARAFVAGNASAEGFDVDAEGTEPAPFPAPPVVTQDAATAACAAVADAGVRPLDATDRSYLAPIALALCEGMPPGNRPPVARAGPDRTATVGAPLAFDGSKSSDPDGDPLAFTWDFGDGTQAAGAAVTHAYGASGIYTVRLVVSDGTATASDELRVTVSAPGGGGGGPGTFGDDFQRPNDDDLGIEWAAVRGTLMVLDGEARNEPGRAEHLAVVRDLGGSRQTAAAEFASVRNSGTALGVVLRYQDERNYYLVYRRSGATSRLVVARVVDGVETVLDWAPVANPRASASFRLAGRADGATLALELNGVDRVSVSDATFATGGVGILVRSSNKDSHRVDNFSATAQ